MKIDVVCPYCGEPAEWVENKVVYGKNYGKSYMIWLCRLCNAYGRCRNNTRKLSGTMANSILRKWRIQAHAKIDPLWQSGTMKRKEVYAILKTVFGREIHVAEADVDTCKRICSLDVAQIMGQTAIEAQGKLDD